ncbi:hypothetical protein [uncultured Olleya sp.]|uniref:hypothetical protein n=1 Tax=uncultured Olleya sp. TaxID=757243 RepID=UPI002595A2F4|nr:hypothetical protein [uncultured Olleya sp.]
MKKSIAILALVASLVSFESIGQTIVHFPDRTFTRENGLNKANDYEDPNIIGSKYIFSVYQPAKLSTHENVLFNVRYNAYNDDIEIQGKEENTSYALNKYSGTIIVSLLSGQNYINTKYVDSKNNSKTGFFQILNTNSNFYLLKKQTIILTDKIEAKTTYHKSKPAKYTQSKDQYFIKKDNNTATEIPTNNKKFAGLFPDQKKEVLSFIKEEKIKLKKEDDLKKIFNFIKKMQKN